LNYSRIFDRPDRVVCKLGAGSTGAAAAEIHSRFVNAFPNLHF
jgi:hypothetical protein